MPSSHRFWTFAIPFTWFTAKSPSSVSRPHKKFKGISPHHSQRYTSYLLDVKLILNLYYVKALHGLPPD